MSNNTQWRPIHNYYFVSVHMTSEQTTYITKLFIVKKLLTTTNTLTSQGPTSEPVGMYSGKFRLREEHTKMIREQTTINLQKKQHKRFNKTT